MEKKQSKWIWKTVVAACIAASILSYMCIPSVKDMMNKIVTMFATGDFGVVREFVASYGNYAAAVSFGLMVLQSVMAPLPAFLITFANANLFGWWQGAILSWSSAMAGAALCFYIARILGRDAAEKLTSKAGLKQIDTFFDKYGKNTILICRLLPFVSFDIVSYGAGLTSMPFLSFHSHGNRTASGDHCILLCGRNADRRRQVLCHRLTDIICLICLCCHGKENIYRKTR